ncbi:MAG TPA: acetyl-CoA carboxylase biotin carboxylase subunit [Candidatus Polarisedimenticolia bacterium]|nr:acetyl-CoA carboxylase biotin carboxylase subunit [Candidatus Polarisedimenticolia bacterium]
MFRRILVANRGEIAARVLRACRSLGIRTVAVHSTADAASPHLKLADRTVCIGPAPAARSYLDMDAVLQAAEQTECQAVHPGYGFLAENALFAARCEAQHLTFIGPTPRMIRLMGDKVEARRTMRAAGIPVIPGSEGALADAAEAARAAAGVGYPVFLKAAAGGGGKGMRRCDDETALGRGFEEASAEARAAFGDGTLYLEKAILGGRHVEFQVLCDAWGAGVHLAERECSVQRHHQKLLEEAPSPAVTPAVREAMGARVAAAASGLGYRSAGTMEFLLDGEGRLHFMEMNTRLQVEHPVTEEITGIDLVAEQIRIAAGERLSVPPGGVRIDGHAVECRINAEDPDQDFRPSPGTITRWAMPPGARIETHAQEGYTVPPHYDSLLAKVVVKGPDRASAFAAMAEALEATAIEGIRTTLPLHRRLVRHPAILSGRYDVGLLDAPLPAAGPARARPSGRRAGRG